MKKCKKCGCVNCEEAKFCRNCGRKLYDDSSFIPIFFAFFLGLLFCIILIVAATKSGDAGAISVLLFCIILIVAATKTDPEEEVVEEEVPAEEAASCEEEVVEEMGPIEEALYCDEGVVEEEVLAEEALPCEEAVAE